MKKTQLLLAAAAFIATNLQAQTKNENINKLCGCFNVEFKYAETFSPDSGYKFHDRELITDAVELALPIVVTDTKISIQHLLVATDSIIVKHWREDWTYENPVIWKYADENKWVKVPVKPEDVKGKWTQTVWEVSDAPRYQGFSQFVNLDGETVWKNTTDAPLPRREYSVRHDYNILKRTNTLHLTDSGYLHEQDNKKIIRKDGVDKLLAEEKGYNTYKRLPASACAAATRYWELNKNYWVKVESIWQQYFATHESINLKDKVDGKPLFAGLFALLKDYTDKKITDADIDKKIRQEIEKYLG